MEKWLYIFRKGNGSFFFRNKKHRRSTIAKSVGRNAYKINVAINSKELKNQVMYKMVAN
jgi:hypothetical protein